MIFIKTMGFNAQVAPGLNNLPRLGEASKVAPLRHGALDFFHGLWVTQRGKVAQRLIQQNSTQCSPHVFARSCFRKG